MEGLLIRLAESKFNMINPHKVHEYTSGILLNEGTVMNYLADLDDFLYELLIHNAKK